MLWCEWVFTHQSIVQADVTLQLRVSVSELHYGHFGTGDRQHLVQPLVLLQLLCEIFNNFNEVQFLKRKACPKQWQKRSKKYCIRLFSWSLLKDSCRKNNTKTYTRTDRGTAGMMPPSPPQVLFQQTECWFPEHPATEHKGHPSWVRVEPQYLKVNPLEGWTGWTRCSGNFILILDIVPTRTYESDFTFGSNSVKVRHRSRSLSLNPNPLQDDPKGSSFASATGTSRVLLLTSRGNVHCLGPFRSNDSPLNNVVTHPDKIPEWILPGLSVLLFFLAVPVPKV